MTAPLVDTQDEQLRKQFYTAFGGYKQALTGHVPVDLLYGDPDGSVEDVIISDLMSLVKAAHEQFARKLFPEYDTITNPSYTFMISKDELDTALQSQSTEPYGAEEVK